MKAGGELDELTPREQEIHDLLILACSRQEIALELCISPHTVRNYAASIYRKTDTFNQLDLILKHYELPTWKKT